MCVNPITLSDGNRVACRWCWACKGRALEALVGRGVSEAVTSQRVDVVTLTYGGDTPHAHYLVTKDVQNMFKRIRRSGYSVRYLGAGEYGDMKGRAHWHLVLFWQGALPPIPAYRERIDWLYWPHGFSYFDHGDYSSIRYSVKYALKQFHGSERGQLRRPLRSLKPPLGYRFHMDRADTLAERRSGLQSATYTVPYVRDRKGRVPSFWLTGRLLDRFIDRYRVSWSLLHDDEPPETDFLLEHLDKIERIRIEDGKMVGSAFPEHREAEASSASAGGNDRFDGC